MIDAAILTIALLLMSLPTEVKTKHLQAKAKEKQISAICDKQTKKTKELCAKWKRDRKEMK